MLEGSTLGEGQLLGDKELGDTPGEEDRELGDNLVVGRPCRDCILQRKYNL